jgi:hypothetical protein
LTLIVSSFAWAPTYIVCQSGCFCDRLNWIPLFPTCPILSAAPRRVFPNKDLWRGVEGSRRCILCEAASGNSHQNFFPRACGLGQRPLSINTIHRWLQFVGTSSGQPLRFRGTKHGENSLDRHGPGRILGMLRLHPESLRSLGATLSRARFFEKEKSVPGVRVLCTSRAPQPDKLLPVHRDVPGSAIGLPWYSCPTPPMPI